MNIQDIIAEFEEDEVLEDRMEYSVQDLMTSEGLTREQAVALQAALHEGDANYREF